MLCPGGILGSYAKVLKLVQRSDKPNPIPHSKTYERYFTSKFKQADPWPSLHGSSITPLPPPKLLKIFYSISLVPPFPLPKRTTTPYQQYFIQNKRERSPGPPWPNTPFSKRNYQ